MGFWFVVLLWAASFAVSQLLAPKPELEDARAATLDQFNFPTATEGRMMPMGWGTDKIGGPNVLWYGNLSAVAVTQRVKTSMFNSKRVIVSYRYHMGFQLGICIGPVALRKIWIGDELVWSGNQTTDGDISITGHPSTEGTFTFYTGSKTQAIDPYLATYQSLAPAYRGLSYGVFKDGYVGNTKQVAPWSFEVTRIPTALGTANPIVNSYDCNPMEMMYELLTDPRDGYGYPDADINLTEFRTAGATLYTEGNGISYTLLAQRKITQLIKMIEKQCDCRFRIDPQTGQWRVILIRDGYSIPGLRDSSGSILEVVDFSRAAWDQTINSIRVSYKRRANNYGASFAPAQDGANMLIQNQVVPAIYTFEGVKDDALANKIVWRELRTHSYPLAKGRFKMDRSFWDAYEGEVFRLNHTIKNIDIEDMPMRITRIDLGNKADPHILVDAVQDIFSWRAASFDDSDTTNWTAPDKNLIPFPSDEQVAFESPYAISRRELYPSEGKIWCSGVSQAREEIGFRIRQRNAAGTPAGDFFDAGDSASFMVIGELDSGIDHDDATIDILTNLPISEIFETTDFNIGNDLTNLFLIENEFVACTGVSTITGGLRLTGCYRGLLDTVGVEHADAVAVYFINTGGQITDTAFDLTNNVHIRMLPFDIHGNIVSEGDGGLTQIDLTMSNRERRPYPPTNLELNSTQYPSGTVSLDVQHGSIEDDKGIKVEWNRRDFRIYDEVSQLDVDAETLDASFPAANTTEYAVEVWKDPDTTPVLLYTTGWQSTATDYAYRSAILRYLDGVIPSRLRITIKTRHTHTSVVYEATQTLNWDFDSASSELSGNFNFGALTDLTISNVWTAPDTGSYTCNISTANTGGPIEYRLNGGGWSTAITTSSLTGSIPGVTANDTIEIRSNGLTLAGVSETIFEALSPVSAEDAYAIFEV